MGKYDWIVLKFDETPNKMWCQRCNIKTEMPKFAQFEVVIAMTKAFTKLHKNCKGNVKYG